MLVGSNRRRAYDVYLIFEGGYATFFATITTLNLVYQVEVVRLNPLQLVLVGTMLEAVCFVLQVPTGALADLYSRRACIIAGTILAGLGFLLEGSVPRFGAVLLAQVLWGAGATLIAGAKEAWIAGEIGEERLAHAFVRGSQVGQVGALVGAASSVALGSMRLNLPIVTGGLLLVALGAVLTFVMPEHKSDSDVAHGERLTWRRLGGTIVSGTRLIRGSALLATILALPLFFGISGEGFDRLWTDHLIQDYAIPPLGSLSPVVWFGILSVGATLLGLAVIEVVRRRANLEDDAALAKTLAVVSGMHVASYVGFGLAGSFPAAVACYWGACVARSTSAPLYNTWLVRSVKPQARATVVSMGGVVDAFGQMAGGPVIGAIGTFASLRAAMVACGVALAPATALYLRAGRLVGAQGVGPPAEAQEADVARK